MLREDSEKGRRGSGYVRIFSSSVPSPAPMKSTKMHPTGTQFLLLALLLSSTGLIFFLNRHASYLPVPGRATSTGSNATHFRNHAPFPPTFSFTIKVLTFNRAGSLSRCLRSLARANYGGDRVGLDIFVDHFGATRGPSLADRKLEESRRILELVDGFRWVHGEKRVHYRTQNAGLQAQWLESWWPGSDDEFVYVVEDDVEVSDLYYRFLKELIARYYYDPENFSPYVYGASLQRMTLVAGIHGNRLKLDAETRMFLHPLVGTWGQLFFPRPWKEFRLWYDNNKAKGIKPHLGGMITDRWYAYKGEKIWTPWIIKFVHSRNYYNMYTNFKDERALSVSHREAGVNYGKAAGPDSPLLDKGSLDFDLWKLQPLMNLKRFDYCSRPVLPGRSARSFAELGSILKSFKKQKTILLLSLYHAAEPLIKNLLCHLERLNVRNYVLIGDDHELLYDLARRGHAVVDGTNFPFRLGKCNRSGSQRSGRELTKEVLVKAYVMKGCLEHGYSTWLIDGIMVPAANAFAQIPASSHDFVVDKDAGILFVKSSPSSLKVWSDDFICEVASAANPLTSIGDALKDEKRHAGRVGVDLVSFGARLGGGSANVSSKNNKKMVFWHPDSKLDFVQKELEKAGLWLLDSEHSCSSVFCHGA